MKRVNTCRQALRSALALLSTLAFAAYDGVPAPLPPETLLDAWMTEGGAGRFFAMSLFAAPGSRETFCKGREASAFAGSQIEPARRSNHCMTLAAGGTSSSLDAGCGVDRHRCMSLRLLGKESCRISQKIPFLFGLCELALEFGDLFVALLARTRKGLVAMQSIPVAPAPRLTRADLQFPADRLVSDTLFTSRRSIRVAAFF